MKQQCKVCGEEFESLMAYPLCLSCGSHAAMFTCDEMFIRINKLEAQLAAEASAVETKRIDEMLSKGVEIRFALVNRIVLAGVLDAKNGALLYTKAGGTFAAALRALTEAEGK